MGFGDNLFKLRERNGLSRKELAAKLDIPYTTLRNYETGQREPGHELLVRLALMFSVSVDSLLGVHIYNKMPSISDDARKAATDYDSLDKYGKKAVRAIINAEMYRMEDTAEESFEGKIIPLFLTPAAAGYASPALGYDYEDYTVPVDFKADFAVKIQGDSMEPYIQDDSVVLVKRSETIRNGDVAIFFVDGDMKCKQYLEDSAGNVRLSSLNRKRADADVLISASSGQEVKSYGKVIMQKQPPIPKF